MSIRDEAARWRNTSDLDAHESTHCLLRGDLEGARRWAESAARSRITHLEWLQTWYDLRPHLKNPYFQPRRRPIR